MRTQYKPRIVISTDKLTATRGENSGNYMLFYKSLIESKTPFLTAKGKYKGQDERSFILDNTPDNLKMALKAMRYFNQDTILTIDNEGTGELVLANGLSEKLGKLEVSDREPQGDHTKVLSTGQYFTFN